MWAGDLGPALEWWSLTDQLPDTEISEWVPEGYAPAFTCSCGDFGCGGALVKITFDRGVVTWTDFTTANYERLVNLGPFNFRRKAYEAALRMASQAQGN